MDYKKIYDAIVEKRRNNIPCGYIEQHHIIPRSFGGQNTKNNMVALTAREHFICHLLLVKIHKNDNYYFKAIHAFMMMMVSSNNQNRITSRMFELYRKYHSSIMSKLQKGDKNSQYGTSWITNGNDNKKIVKNEKIPDGWKLGRTIEEDKIRKLIQIENRKKVKLKKYFEKIEYEDKEKQQIQYLYDRYVSGESIRKLAKEYRFSHVTLFKKFKKYFSHIY